jgi:large subunit ribosomal protein L34e
MYTQIYSSRFRRSVCGIMSGLISQLRLFDQLCSFSSHCSRQIPASTDSVKLFQRRPYPPSTSRLPDRPYSSLRVSSAIHKPEFYLALIHRIDMAQRVTLRKRQPYNTTSNRRRIVKTPGGKLVYHHLKKPATAPKCGDCGIGLPGIPALRPREYATISKRQKSVRRAYGGSRCGDCVKSRIMRAFLVEEAKIVKRVIKSQQK